LLSLLTTTSQETRLTVYRLNGDNRWNAIHQFVTEENCNEYVDALAASTPFEYKVEVKPLRPETVKWDSRGRARKAGLPQGK